MSKVKKNKNINNLTAIKSSTKAINDRLNNHLNNPNVISKQFGNLQDRREHYKKKLIERFRLEHEKDKNFFIKFEIYGSNIEKSIYNTTLRHCRKNDVPLTWGNKYLRDIFSKTYRKVVYNLFICPNHQYLLDKIKNKEIDPKDVASMSHYELDKDTWDDIHQENIDIIIKMMEKEEIKDDGILCCPKCKSFKTTSEQKQTRSADEPMTVFARCGKCSHRWRF